MQVTLQTQGNNKGNGNLSVDEDGDDGDDDAKVSRSGTSVSQAFIVPYLGSRVTDVLLSIQSRFFRTIGAWLS